MRLLAALFLVGLGYTYLVINREEPKRGTLAEHEELSVDERTERAEARLEALEQRLAEREAERIKKDEAKTFCMSVYVVAVRMFSSQQFNQLGEVSRWLAETNDPRLYAVIPDLHRSVQYVRKYRTDEERRMASSGFASGASAACRETYQSLVAQLDQTDAASR